MNWKRIVYPLSLMGAFAGGNLVIDNLMLGIGVLLVSSALLLLHFYLRKNKY